MTDTIDFQFTNHGTTVLIHPVSDNAKDSVPTLFGEDAQRFGQAVVVEPRYAADIAEDLYFTHGYDLTIDGVRCDAERGEG